MSSFTRILLAFLLVLSVFSCSGKEDPLIPQDSPLSIILSSDAGSGELLVVPPDSVVVFTVTGSDGADYTGESDIYIDNEKIAGFSHSFENTGSYEVKAVYEGIESNRLNFQVLEPTQRALTIDVIQALRNQIVTFGLLDSQGNNTADEAVFYVNGNPIEGYQFSSAAPGDFEVYAVYEVNDETYESETKDFEVFVPKRKVVIEDYTGTWCGYCPAVALAIEEIRSVTEHVAVVSIHKQGASLPDPLDFPMIGELQAMFDVSNSFPKAQLNRTTAWLDPYEAEEVMSMAGRETDVSIAVDSKLEGASLRVKVRVVYENGSVSGDKLVVYLLENGVVAAQANYFNEVPGHPYQGMGNPIPNYVHNDGLRNSLSDLFGDPIAETAAFEHFSKEYFFEVPADYVGENLSFVVMVVDSDNTAKNAQFAKINQNKKFE